MKQVRFKKQWGLWNAMEVAGFEDAIAAGYVRAGIASSVEESAPPSIDDLKAGLESHAALPMLDPALLKEEPEEPAKE